MVSLSVVIPTLNRAGLLERCLDSMASQTFPLADLEVVVVDNGSVDDTARVIERFSVKIPRLVSLAEPARGHSQARNRGWRTAAGRYVAFIDDDAEAAPDWCRLILETFDKVSPRPTAIGGRILPRYAAVPPPWFQDSLEIRTWGDEPGFLKPDMARYGFSGGNVAVRKDVLEKYGGFSAEFGMVGGRLRMGEDTEFFHRLGEEDRLLWYDPAIVVRHFTPERNFSILYRMRRSFNTGRSIAAMEGRVRLSWKSLRSLAGLALNTAALPLRLSAGKGSFRYRLVVQMQDLSYRCGALVR